MSLETGSWIKDLVASNPLGTDPKSQGDDHLRLLKMVLKSQFSGLTLGKAITLNEDQLNAAVIAGQAGLRGLVTYINDCNAIPNESGFYGLSALANAWPGAQLGDMLIHMVYNGNVKAQLGIGYISNWVFVRTWNVSAWGPWATVYDKTSRQSLAYGANYSDANTARCIRRSGITYLEGLIAKNGVVQPLDLIATLPVGYRPENLTSVAVMIAYPNLASQMGEVVLHLDGRLAFNYVATIAGTPSGAGQFSIQAAFVAAP